VRVSIVITTRNRKEELRIALSSALGQTAHPEVVVIDDGSTDGTAEMVRANFASVRLECFETSQGYIVQRNRGAHLAKGRILFSIDDDAEFSTPHIVEQTLRDFDHPRIGAIAIPYLEPKKDNQGPHLPPDDRATWVTGAFIGSAHAVRRNVFLQLGGYREKLVHQGEERDFCLRMLNAGYVTRLGRADLIHHMESPRRDFRRMDFYGRRNDILFAWQNVPAPYFTAHLLGTTWNGLRFALRCGRGREQFRGIIAGYSEIVCRKHKRQRVTRTAYRLQRRLQKRGPFRLNEIEAELMALAPVVPDPEPQPLSC
jgi:glycosyltransferase involved in cell wall biosynthesis